MRCCKHKIELLLKVVPFLILHHVQSSTAETSHNEECYFVNYYDVIAGVSFITITSIHTRICIIA